LWKIRPAINQKTITAKIIYKALIMKYLLKCLVSSYVFLILCSQISSAQAINEFKPASSNLAGSEYPKISSDNRVMFRLVALNATKVQVRIGPGQTVDLLKDSTGNWIGITPPVSPGFNPYSITVDGTQVSEHGSDLYYSSSIPQWNRRFFTRY
jgi:hypothetical protein